MNEVMNYNGEDKFEIFNFENLGSVRTSIGNGGQPLFCLKDVSDTLDINNPSMLVRRIDDPYLTTIEVWVQTGTKTDGTPAMRSTPMIFVSEAGLYQAIGQSRKPAAKRFMNWIFSEVIPSIRKTGSYSLENDDSLTPTTKAIVAHDRMLSAHSKILYTHSREIKNMKTRQNELENRQVSLIEEGYHAILRFAQYYGIDTTERDRQILGKKATAICNLRGIPMGQEPAGRFIANTYPYPVLVEVFQEFVSDNNN